VRQRTPKTISKADLRRKLERYASDRECYFLADTLHRKFRFLKQEGGFYLRHGEFLDHCWNVLPDGTVVDAAYSQFSPKVKIGIWPRGSKEYDKYVSFQRHYPVILKAIKQGKLTWSEIGLDLPSCRGDIEDIKKDYNWDDL